MESYISVGRQAKTYSAALCGHRVWSRGVARNDGRQRRMLRERERERERERGKSVLSAEDDDDV